MAMGLEWTHAEGLYQRQRLPVPRLALDHLWWVGLGVDGTELAECFRLEPTLPILLGQGECLACVLHGLINAACQETDRAEPCNIEGLTMQRTTAATFPKRLLQECSPLCEAAHERIGIA